MDRGASISVSTLKVGRRRQGARKTWWSTNGSPVFSTWPAEAGVVVTVGEPWPEQGRFRAMLVDDVGEWWQYEHRHPSGSEATRCAREQLEQPS